MHEEQLEFPGMGISKLLYRKIEEGDVLESDFHKEVMGREISAEDRVEALKEELRGVLHALNEMENDRDELNKRIRDAVAVAHTFRDAIDTLNYPEPKQEEELGPGSHS